MSPLELMEALVAWIMAAEYREWFMFGMLAGCSRSCPATG